MNDIDEDKILKESVRKNIDEKEKREKEASMGNIKKAEEEIHISKIMGITDNFECWTDDEIDVIVCGKRADLIMLRGTEIYRVRKHDGQQLTIWTTKNDALDDFADIEENKE